MKRLLGLVGLVGLLGLVGLVLVDAEVVRGVDSSHERRGI